MEKHGVDLMALIEKQIKDIKHNETKVIFCPKCNNIMNVFKDYYGKVFCKCESEHCVSLCFIY